MNKSIYKVELHFRCIHTQQTTVLPCLLTLIDGYQYYEPMEWAVKFNGAIVGEPDKNPETAIVNALLSKSARVAAGFTDKSDLACASKLIIQEK